MFLCAFVKNLNFAGQSKTLTGLRKVVAFILLLMFLFNSMGYYFLFQFHKYEVSRNRQLSDRFSPDLVVLTVSNIDKTAGFKRIDENEIRLNGKLYDVIKEVRKGSLSVFYCFRDTKEENILIAMKNVNSDRDHSSCFGFMFTLAMPLYSFILSHRSTSKVTFPQFSVRLNSCLTFPLSPPPEVS